jgi:fumarylacetoacetase
LAKNFLTTVSPWIITVEALAPFRIPQAARPEGDPHPLPYLWAEEDQATGAFAVALEVLIRTEAMRRDGLEPHAISLSSARNLYWTAAQLVAHHTSGGCDLNPGDLFGSGTISTPDDVGLGSLLEMTVGGQTPISLPNGEQRTYLQDGDEVTLRGRASAPGFVSIGFGPCVGEVLAGAPER